MASIALATGPAFAQVSSGWSQFQGDAGHTGVATGGTGPPFRLAWHAPIEPGGPLGTQGVSSPIIAGDLVITVAPEEVIAFQLGTGAEAWSVPRTVGPPSQPAIAQIDGRSVLLFTEGWAGHPPVPGATGPTGIDPTASPSSNDGEATGPVDSRLVAIDLETREQLWEPIELTEVSRSGVTVNGDRAYVADMRGELFAVDIGVGTVAWTGSIDRPVDGAPAAAGSAVVVTGRGTVDAPGALVVAFDAVDGAERWRQDVDSPAIVFSSAPSLRDDLVLVALSDATVRAFDLDSGEERWSSGLGTTPTLFESAVVQSNDAAFVSDSIGITGSVYRIERSSGLVVWDFAINEPIVRGAPVVSGGSLLVATNEGSLNAFDPATGERIWRGDRQGALSSLASTGSVVVGVRGRPRAGLDAFVSDPEGRLMREASPTTPAYARILGSFVIAAVPLAGLALLAGRLLTARMGPAFEDEGEDEGEDV